VHVLPLHILALDKDVFLSFQPAFFANFHVHVCMFIAMCLSQSH
jgi:hypothetical protein